MLFCGRARQEDAASLGIDRPLCREGRILVMARDRLARVESASQNSLRLDLKQEVDREVNLPLALPGLSPPFRERVDSTRIVDG